MKIAKLVRNFRMQGYEITLDGDQLECKGTKYPFTENQVAVLKKYKKQIIWFLQREQRKNNA